MGSLDERRVSFGIDDLRVLYHDAIEVVATSLVISAGVGLTVILNWHARYILLLVLKCLCLGAECKTSRCHAVVRG